MMKDRSCKAPYVIDACVVLNIVYTLLLDRFGVSVEPQGRTSTGADEMRGTLACQMICLPRC